MKCGRASPMMPGTPDKAGLQRRTTAGDPSQPHCSKQRETSVTTETTTTNPNQLLWEKGDFTRIAGSMRESGEALVKSLGVTKGLRVLDLGCGDGTTAIPEATLGANVLGVDIARNLVEAGNKRAAEYGLTNLKFQQGDASDLRDLKAQSF